MKGNYRFRNKYYRFCYHTRIQFLYEITKKIDNYEIGQLINNSFSDIMPQDFLRSLHWDHSGQVTSGLDRSFLYTRPEKHGVVNNATMLTARNIYIRHMKRKTAVERTIYSVYHFWSGILPRHPGHVIHLYIITSRTPVVLLRGAVSVFKKTRPQPS